MGARGRRGLAARASFDVPDVPDVPAFDDTRMTDTGLARHGPGSFYGFTAVDGSGDVTVYNGTDATGTVIQTQVAPTPGVFYAAPSGPIACDSVWVVQGARNVDYRID